MALLTEPQRNQARVYISRMFQYGQDGRDLGRFLIAEKGKGSEGKYYEVKKELLDLMDEMIDKFYLSEPPKMSR